MFLFTFNKIEGGRPGPAAARTAAVRVPAVTTLDDLPSLPGLASLARAREYSDFRRASSMAAGPRLLQPALLLRAAGLASPNLNGRVSESDAAALVDRLGVDSDSESRRRPSDSEHTPTTPHRARPLQTHSGRLSRRPQSGSGLRLNTNEK
jgi:hypothetical protein